MAVRVPSGATFCVKDTPCQYTARVATLELHNRPEPLLPLPRTCPHSDSPHVRPLPRHTNDPNSALDWFECLTCGRLALAAIRLEVRGLPAVRASGRVHTTSAWRPAVQLIPGLERVTKTHYALGIRSSQ